MLYMNRLEFSCFADFLQGFLKPGKNMVFYPPVEGNVNNMELEFYAKPMSKNSISGLYLLEKVAVFFVVIFKISLHSKVFFFSLYTRNSKKSTLCLQ
jgi:hypothetical protein